MKRAYDEMAQPGVHTKYEEMNKIGSGAYGIVYKGRNRVDNSVVALKRIRISLRDEGVPSNTLREISLLKHLSNFEHANILKILDVYHWKRLDKELNMYIVFEHMEEDLASYLDRHTKTGGFTPQRIKQMSRDILSGVDFLHSHRIVHRDLKPQNLLVNNVGTIKLADFGLAKIYDCEMTLTTVVVTLWYRSPEVLLGLPYASPVDIWSVGCIIAELYMLKPLFCGDAEVSQLKEIFKVLGLPGRDDWPEEKVSLNYHSFAEDGNIDIKKLIPNLCDQAYDLIMSMLTFNPAKRITASGALIHDYFQDL